MLINTNFPGGHLEIFSEGSANKGRYGGVLVLCFL